MKRGLNLVAGLSALQLGTLFALVNVSVLLAPMPVRSTTPSDPLRIVAFGDSLTAGYLLQPSQSFPAKLSVALKAKGHNVEVINSGVSGDTTAAGLERFAWAVPDNVDAVILELGANDALRGLDPKLARKNLETIISRLKGKRIDVLLVGMSAPRNWGPDYAKDFDAIYPELSRKHGLLLYPFFLEGVALNAALNLNDGLHPNAKGIDAIVSRIMPKVEELIARVAAAKATSATR